MATNVGSRRFVDEILTEIIRPGAQQLMEGRYFTALRAGKLSTRQLGGFAIQHYVHNMAVLKAFALGAVQNASNDRAFMALAGGLYDEFTHPDMCKKFGLALGLTEADFDDALPIYECRAHTAAVIHGMYLATPSELRANALTNETMVQRYAEEFDTWLRKNYDLPEDALEFFVVHKAADIEHTEASANFIASAATDEAEQARVRAVCKDMVRLKLGKFDGIYEAYA